MDLSPAMLKSMSYEEAYELCERVRAYMIDTVMKTGGHLASNLGIVEITVALHRVFETPADKIVWDVGHQSYVHKLLTGRWDNFPTIRQFNGLSGFPRREESEHDSFNTGHSSTSISAAMGLAYANSIKGESGKVIAVIGDGALTGGMAYEAINDLGSKKLPVIIVLNDNGMSIAKNVGALNFHLSKLRSGKKYIHIKKRIAKKHPRIKFWLERIKNSIKYLMLPSAFFEEMGIKYLGPIDGHDLKALETVMRQACHFDVPVIIHAVTVKGKGYACAEENPQKFHGVSPVSTDQHDSAAPSLTNGAIVANTICQLAKEDSSIVAITAAMTHGTGLQTFAEKFPDRFFDVGIAEQHAMTLAAGMAAGGLRPVFAVYSSFLQRAYDQVLHDVCLQNLPVAIAIDRSGPVGEDGPTHHGIYDISYLSNMPNLVCFSASTQQELCEMIKIALSRQGPTSVRYTRSLLPSLPLNNTIEVGKWELCSQLSDTMIVATGQMVAVARQVASSLMRNGIVAGVYNARCVKPIDFSALEQLKNCRSVYTIEDGALTGGIGQQIAAALSPFGTKVHSFGFGVEPLRHGTLPQLMKHAGLTGAQIADDILVFEGVHNARQSQA